MDYPWVVLVETRPGIPIASVFPPVGRVDLPWWDCHEPGLGMASSPSVCKKVGPVEEENGEPDHSLQEMLKAIADERNRLTVRQETSGLGE